MAAVRLCLDNGYDVIVEGILAVVGYGEMLSGLRDDHRGTTIAYYLDVDFDETDERRDSAATRNRYPCWPDHAAAP
jgi:hypothetical protein